MSQEQSRTNITVKKKRLTENRVNPTYIILVSFLVDASRKQFTISVSVMEKNAISTLKPVKNNFDFRLIQTLKLKNNSVISVYYFITELLFRCL